MIRQMKNYEQKRPLRKHSALLPLFVALIIFMMLIASGMFSAVSAIDIAGQNDLHAPLPQCNALNGVVFKEGYPAWAVGNNGTIIMSGNNYEAENWTILNSGTTKKLNDITHNEQVFVVVGDSGTILTSNQDGLIWAERNSGVDFNLNSVAWGGPSGQQFFVAVGDSPAAEASTIRYSPDGVTWYSSSAPPSTANFRAITWGGLSGQEKFVAVGAGGEILYSSDGYTWLKVTSKPTTQQLNGVTWAGTTAAGQEKFVAVGQSGTILTSPDGVNWTASKQSDDHFNDIIWMEQNFTGNQSQFVAVGTEGSIYTSSNGANWTKQNSGTNRDLNAVQWSNYVFLTVGNDGLLLHSADGNIWSQKSSSANIADQWEWRNPLPQGNPINGLVFKEGYPAWAVGNNGTIIMSGNNYEAENWVILDSGTTKKLNAITHNEQTFVVVGHGGTILTSDEDGEVWTMQSSGISSNLRSVAWGGLAGSELFVVVGDSPVSQPSTIINSDDGITWHQSASPPSSSNLHAVTWGGLAGQEKFVTVGDHGVIMYSSNGKAWTKATSPTTNQLLGVTWAGTTAAGQEKFVAVGRSGTVLTSPDGITWTATVPLDNHQLNDVVWVENNYSGIQRKFVTVGGGGVIYTSTNGVLWTRQNAESSSNLYAVQWSNYVFIAVGNDGAITYSQDGINWENKTRSVTAVQTAFNDIGYNDNLYVAVGGHVAGEIFTSADGFTWSERTSGTNFVLNGVAWGDPSSGSRFVAVGEGGTILTSATGTTWSGMSPLLGGNNLKGVTWGGSAGQKKYVSVGWSGTIATSVDGINWTLQSSGTTDHLTAVTWNGTIFLAVGNSGTVLTSPNGITWTKQTSGISANLRGVTWGNDQFVAVGTEGSIYTSPTGIAWAMQTSPVSTFLNAVTWGGSAEHGQYVIVGGDLSDIAALLTSSDGVTWTNRSITTNSLNGITWGEDEFIAVGNYGTIIGPQSSPPQWSPHLVSPADNSRVSDSAITFNWQPVAQATHYLLRVYETATGIDLFYGCVGNNTSQTVEGFLADDTAYSWSVWACNSVGTGPGLSVWQFTSGPVEETPPKKQWSNLTPATAQAMAYRNGVLVASFEGFGTYLRGTGGIWTLLTGASARVLAYDAGVLAASFDGFGTYLRDTDGNWTQLTGASAQVLAFSEGVLVASFDGFGTYLRDVGGNWTLLTGASARALAYDGWILAASFDGFGTYLRESGGPWTQVSSATAVALAIDDGVLAASFDGFGTYLMNPDHSWHNITAASANILAFDGGVLAASLPGFETYLRDAGGNWLNTEAPSAESMVFNNGQLIVSFTGHGVFIYE